MLNKLVNYFSSSKTSASEFFSEALEGQLFKKKLNETPKSLSQQVMISLSCLDESTFEYNFNLLNKSKKQTSWESMFFELNDELCPKLFTDKSNSATLVWEKNREFYLFEVDEEFSEEQISKFLKNFCVLIYSNTIETHPTKVNPEEAKEALIYYGDVGDINAFLEENYKKIYQDASSNLVSESSLETEVKEKMEKLSINDKSKKKGVEAVEEKASTGSGRTSNKPIQYFKSSYPSAELIIQGKGQINQYINSTDSLEVLGKNALFQIFKIENFSYFIVVDDLSKSNTTLVCTQISNLSNINVVSKECLIMWVRFTEGDPEVFNFLFYDRESMDNIIKVVTKSQFEANSHTNFEDLGEEDKQWIQDAMEEDSDVYGEEMKDVIMDYEKEYTEDVSDLKNKVTAQAYLHDRTFVIKEDNSIGVYKTDENDNLTHLINLPSVTKYGEKNIEISHAQMFNSDSSILFLDKNNRNSAFKYDLTKSQIVEEWGAEKITRINAINPQNKLDQMTPNQVITGISKNAMFLLDPRVNKTNKLVELKEYKSNPKMSCMATTEFGGLAIGSLDGKIRLYRAVGQNAKTLLPGLGDEIKSIDVTGDGKYLLATCSTYLLIIPTTCKGEKDGFNVSMGKEKPKPKLLKLNPNDIAKYQLKKIEFTPARFNIDKVNGETNIITSTGEYIINWSFSKVLKGVLNDYKMKKVNQNVLGNQFKFNKSQIVVTMDKNLMFQNQKTIC